MTRRRAWLVVLAVSGGCIEESADDPVIGETSGAITPVTWSSLVGVSGNANSLTKTAAPDTWGAGAVSVQSLAGDGFVEFESGEATTSKMAGLSNGNTNQGRADIDFAILLSAAGSASVWEGGVNRGNIGTYVAGDRFRVQADGGVVTYYRNGVLRYTSALAPSFPLLVDTSLKTPGATIKDVVLQPIDVWTSPVGVSVSGRDITKTAPEDAFDAGAISLETIPSGDGFVEFRVADRTTGKVAGLATGNSSNSRSDIEFAISLSAGGLISVYESGTLRGSHGQYQAGDVFRVQVEGGVVTYLRNREPFRTSLVAPTYPLLLDTSIRTPGGSIQDAKVVSGYVTDECVSLEDSLPSSDVIDAEGDILLVGRPGATPPVAEVWRRSDSGWALEETLNRPAAPVGTSFAYRLATDGETLAIELEAANGTGFVAMYRFDGADWILEDVVERCIGSGGIDVKGDLLVTGGDRFANADDTAYVYRRDGAGTWNLDGALPGGFFEGFGTNLAVGGDRVFVGAYARDPAGAVDVFRYNATLPDPPPPSCANLSPGKWRHRSELVAADPHEFGRWKLDANRDGTRFVVADYRIDAHLFEIEGGVWTETILAPTPFEWTAAKVDFGGEGPDEDSVVVMCGAHDMYVHAELADGWTQIEHIAPASTCAAAGDSVFARDASTAIDVYSLDGLCLAE